jgi:hypothetical protein
MARHGQITTVGIAANTTAETVTQTNVIEDALQCSNRNARPGPHDSSAAAQQK